jgi:hypothetical protein
MTHETKFLRFPHSSTFVSGKARFTNLRHLSRAKASHTVELDTHYVSKVRWFAASIGLLLAVAAIVVAGTLLEDRSRFYKTASTEIFG